MTEKSTHQIKITTSTTNKELSEVARQVAELLPSSQWIEGTPDILLANLDLNAIKTAVNLVGGMNFEIEPPLPFPETEITRILPGDRPLSPSTQDNVTSNSLFLVDEFSLLRRYNNWIGELLQVPGIPNTTYSVANGQVFVFALLKQQVEAMLRANPSAAISEIALLALPSAWVEAKEAIEEFEIVPFPYERIELEGRLAILYKPFNAVLPPRFNKESDRSVALAELLLGKTLVGNGEFEFRGQPMTLLEPIDLNSLPPVPELNFIESENQALSDYIHLESIDYIPGFPLLDFETFAAIKQAEISWVRANAYIDNFIYQNISLIWQKITQTSLDWRLLDIDEDVPSYDQQNFHELRSIYSELDNLSDQTLYWQFDSYQVNCHNTIIWEPSRDETFLFYLLGLVITRNKLEGRETVKVREFVAYKLVNNIMSEAVVRQGQIWLDYDNAITKLVEQICRIIRFLRENNPNQGSPIRTLNSFGREGMRASSAIPRK